MAELGYRGAIIATAAEVREVVAQFMSENGVAESWTVTWRTPKLLGLDTGGWPGDQYKHQVLRALNWMAGQGVLVKIGKGEQRPDGGWTGVHPVFYTRTAWLAAKRDADDAQRYAAEALEGWQHVYDRAVTEAGLRPLNDRGQPLSLSWASWMDLLDRLAGGA